MFDLITIGDCSIDTFVVLLEAGVAEVTGQKKLVLNYGDKLLAEPAVSFIGGNAANTAVGSARLKLKTAIYTHDGNKGDDRDDDRIKNKFKAEGVDTRYLIEDDEFVSDHHIALVFKGERTILTSHQLWRYSLPDIASAKWVYFSSVSPSFVKSGLIGQIERYLERTGAKLVYNPGTHQLNHGVKKFPGILTMTKLFIVNKEEAKVVLGHSITANIPVKKLLKELTDLGPEMVVITDGGKGSYGYDGEKYYSLDTFPAKLVEMTGAGDAYSTGTLAGLHHGKSLPEAMRWGAANAAGVVEQVGPQAGLLTYNQMMEKLKESAKILAKEI